MLSVIIYRNIVSPNLSLRYCGKRESFNKFQIISLENDRGYAHWQATCRRIPTRAQVALDGILHAKFNRAGDCTEFREWWHRQES